MQPSAEMRDSLDVAQIPRERAYGLGPRQQRLLVSASWASEGKTGGLAYTGTDPVGKLTWLLQGQWGIARAGVAHRSAPSFAEAARCSASRLSRSRTVPRISTRSAHRSRSTRAIAAHPRGPRSTVDQRSHDVDVRALASYGTVDPVLDAPMHRALAQLGVRGAFLQTPGDWRLSERAGLRSRAAISVEADSLAPL